MRLVDLCGLHVCKGGRRDYRRSSGTEYSVECLRIFTRILLELEYDVNSNLFQIWKLCLRFLIYVMLENFRIDNQHGLCAEKC
jgi:hypothetical protein